MSSPAQAETGAAAATTSTDQLAIGSADKSVTEAKEHFAELNAQMEANLAAVEQRRDEQDKALA